MSKFQDRLKQDNVSNLPKQDFIRKATDRKFYGYTFDQAGRHPLTLALDFFTKDGNRFGVFYMEVASPIMFNLGDGTTAQTITIRTSTMEITIEGKNLAPVYEYILEQRLVWVKEVESSFTPEDSETVIESITYESKA